MKDYAPEDTLVAKSDKFYLAQCLKTILEIKEMQKGPDASAIRSVMYAQICMHPNIAFIVEVLDRYLRNPRMDH